MEKTVENLELMFDKADADVKNLTLRLERQLDLEKGKKEQNPVRLMKEIEGVKTEYTNLRQEISGIQAAQKDAVDFLRAQLLTMSEMVQKLETQTGHRNPELEETSQGMLTELSQLMGVPVESLQAPVEQNAADSGQCEAGEPEGAAAQTGAPTCAEASVSEVSQKSSAAEQRLATSEFVEVSEEEFASVSDLIRGRAKLDDVNRTYSLLWDHFKVQNHTEELTAKDMNAMGLRVSGATGQAKLKILRALKLCKISKAGSVILL